MSVTAQWAWQGQLYFNVNQNLALPVNIVGDVDITVAEGFTVRAPQAVTGNGFTMTKKGGGRFRFQADNPLFDANIVYAGKSDTVQLDGIFGSFVNDSIGYLYAGNIISSADSVSFFYLHQNDTVVQTFDARGYNNSNTNLYIYSDTRSTLRIIHSSDSLAGKVELSQGGTLYMDGTKQAKILVTDGRLITGEDSVSLSALKFKDCAKFSSWTSTDTAIAINNSTLQIGTYSGPSLVNVTAGNVFQKNSSILKIDVYDPDPAVNYNLTSGIHSDWVNSFSDRIYMVDGKYNFEAGSKIDVNWSTEFKNSISNDDEFYLPVIMTSPGTANSGITGATNVSLDQNLSKWILEFFTGDGNNGTQTGWGYIRGIRIPLPDNISDAECYTAPPKGVWSIRQLYRSTEEVFEMSIPLVGDIDKDGVVEIVVAGKSIDHSLYPYTATFATDSIKVFNGATQTLKYKFPVERFHPGFGTIAMADVNSDGYAEIFVATNEDAAAGNQGYIYCYEYDNNTYKFKWKSTDVYTTDVARCSFPYLSITDFNGDGIPDIVANDRIFNAENGDLLLDCQLIANSLDYGTGAGHATDSGTEPDSKGAFSSIADMDGDGLPELVAGRNIYKITINPLNPAMNTCTTLRSVTGTATGLGDGYTTIVDLNLDGHLDVVVGREEGGTKYLYAWDGLTGALFDVVSIANGVTRYGGSIPFLGDLDGDGVPEIACTVANQLLAYKFDKATSTINPMSWSLNTTDASASTTLTLFDFDQDGKMELVYRDESDLRIIDGTTGNNKTTPIPCFSWTMNEYPVVADVTGDGHANIVVLGKTAQASHGNGYLYIFDSDLSVPGATPWAPARKVWNQWGYNAVNVKENLTVPKFQLNPATLFPGKDGVSGTLDDVRPYNGFLMQQTILNKDGDPLWLTPDAYLSSNPTFFYDAAGDSLSVHLDITNTGDASLQAPFYIATYKNIIATPNNLTVDSVLTTLNAGDNIAKTIVIRNISTRSLASTDSILLHINDRGQALIVQKECDTVNNRIPIRVSSLLMAHNDTVSTIANMPVLVPVLKNDSIPAGCTPIPTVTVPPGHGTATVIHDSIRYSPASGYAGHDTLTYRIICGSDSSTANVYIYIAEKPDNINDGDCYITPPVIDFSMKLLTATTTNDLDVITTPLIGDIDNDGEIEILHPDRLIGDGNAVANSTTTLRIYGVKVTATATASNPQMYLKYSIPLAINDFIASGTTLTPSQFSNNTFYTFAKVDPANSTTGKKYAAIFLATISGKLYKYEFDPTANQYVQTHSVVFNPYNFHYIGARPILSDLMGDGHVQVCILDKIYDAQTLTLLATLRDNANNPAVQLNNALSPYSFGFVSHGVEYWGNNTYSEPSLVVSIDDVDNDGKKEIIAGDCVYKVDLTNYSGDTGNTYRLAVRANKRADLTTDIETRTDIWDGCGVVVDVDLDGKKDIVVVSRKGMATNTGYLYAYDPLTGTVKNTTATSFPRTSSWSGGPSFPFIGDVDGDKYPEICFGAGVNDLYAYKYNTSTHSFDQFWHTKTTDNTGCIGLSLFDFKQSGQGEIVYRDNNHLYIWDGSQNPPSSINPPLSGNLESASAAEYPVIADVNGDGAADIIVTGGSGNGFKGNIRIYTSASVPWPFARKVWHMSPSHPLYINEDLTIPSHPIDPTTRFPGADGILGNSDDVWPYNNYMQQQTSLNRNGELLWLTPNAVPDGTLTSTDVVGDSVSITIGIVNEGDATLRSPVYVTLYRESVSGTIIATDSANISINKGDTGYVTVRIPDITPFLPMVNIVVRVNDNGTKFPYQEECDITNIIDILNPAIRLMMRKNATLNGVRNSGTYPNPVSVLYGENIKYEITTVNANQQAGNVIITDTLPPYLNYAGNATGGATVSNTPGTPQQTVLQWTLNNRPSQSLDTVKYEATPESGASASQPLFINRAWVRVSDTIFVTTNSTYHQGAGVAVVTFSASPGGSLFNAREQALDYRTSPRSGILVVPDEGYEFAGWSHDEYTSLRGETVKADSGIMNYGDIMIYGNVELHARFVPQKEKSVEKETVEEEPADNSDKVWSHEKYLYIRAKKGTIARIYTTEGILQRMFTVTEDGATTVSLERGVYIVTLNDGAGYKVIVE